MRRILFCIESMDVNGAMKSLIALLKALPREKYDISLFISSHDGVLMNELPKDVTLLKEYPAYAVFRRSFKKGLVCALRAFRFDLFFFRIFVPFLRWFKLSNVRFWFLRPMIRGEWDVAIAYADGFIAEVVSKKVRSQKKFLWIHNDYEKCPESITTAKAFREVSGAVAVSNDSIKMFKVWYLNLLGLNYPNRVKVVYNIIDEKDVLERAFQKKNIPSKVCKIRMITVGRITAQKGVLLIPEIAQRLVEKNVDFEWFVIGDGDLLEECIKRTQELGVNNRLYFIGQQENPMPLLATADIVVQPSCFEGWGMTVSEALLLKKPVVATNLTVFKEQIDEGKNGLLVAFNAVEFANAIAYLINNPDLMQEMATYSKDYPFSIANVCCQFDELVNHE